MRSIAIENEDTSTLTEEELNQLEDFQDLNDSTSEALLVENQEADRTMDTIHALECLCETLENKETLTDEDVMRLRTADMFAATGTDAEPGQIVPAVESHSDANIAMEGILDSIQNGIASLAQSSTIINSAVEKRLAGITVLISTFEKRQASLANALNSNKDFKSVKRSITVTLPANDGKVKTINDYIKMIEDNYKDVSLIVDVHLKEGVELNNSIGKTFSSFANGKYSETIVNTFNLFNDDVLGNISKKWEVVDTDKLKKSAVSSTFSGSQKIKFTISNVAMGVEDNRSTKRSLIDTLGFHIWTGTPSNQSRSVVFDSVTEADIRKILAVTTKTLETLRKYRNSAAHFFSSARNIMKVIHLDRNLGGSVKAILANYGGLVKSIAANADATTLAKLGQLGLVSTGAAVGAVPAIAIGYGFATLENWLRKLILAWIFTTMKLQYRVTAYMGFVNSQVIGLTTKMVSNNLTITTRFVKA